MAGQQANIGTFKAPLAGPGRLAPTLLEDLSLYDPNLAGRLSLLRDNPFEFFNGDTLGEQVPPAGCRHEFWLKPRQSNLPEVDEQPTPETRWRAAVICCKCRVHLTLDVDYTIRWQPAPCPNVNHPLHHLIRSEWREQLEHNRWEQDNPGRRSDIAVFECSSDTCSATVIVRYQPPEIDPSEVETLISKDKLRARTEAAFQVYSGNTQGMKQPLPIDVLRDLRIYVQNSWNQESQYRSIKLANKRFVVRFGTNGEPCKDILESFGFRLDESQECWCVPEPDIEEPEPFLSQKNIILDNLIHELSALVAQRPPEELQQHPDIVTPAPAIQQLERTLSCQNYDKHLASRRIGSKLFEFAETRPAPYNTLGAPQSASDDLIVQAYREQMRSADRRTGPTYLGSLRNIGVSRSSEIIQEIYVLEMSKGLYDDQALADSYRSIGLELQRDGHYDDAYILGMFSSRLEDMKKHERDLREKLRIIGDYRGSRTIIDTAENTINTYEQALLFLGADESVSDDQITALFGAKVGDNKNLETQARTAVRLIADYRHSIILQNWINSGFAATDLQMSAAEGYQALQIDNRTIEDDLIITQYDFVVAENSANAEYYTKALEAITRDRDSVYLRNHLQHAAPQPAHGSIEDPVGLDNIGNTCYLNSLLQFLFTMLELRQVVLGFDQYRMEVSESNMLQKKVGQRRVTDREVQTAQKFIENLALLFKGMIETPQSAIRPEKELARLTLESDSAKERVRRRSTLRGDRPSLGHIDSRPIMGPLPMLDAQVNGITDDEISRSPLELEPAIVSLDDIFAAEDWHKPKSTDFDAVSNKEDSSEATLVSRPGSISTPMVDIPTVEEQQAILDNKENLSPTKETPALNLDDYDVQPLAPASPSKVNAQAGALLKQGTEAEETKVPVIYAPPPGKPPPVPPRKPVEPTTDILEEYARQQDVTEVIAHCLFQFSCAMRPTGVDKSGEQLDEIHDMFFGRNIGHVVGGKESAIPVQFYSIITRVANEPNDVYAALDTEYDLSVRDNGTSAFLSIAKAPPVFSIALDRVVWDAHLKRPTKLNHHVHVPETIFLDRYLESAEGSELMERRQQTWQLKKELSTLNERRKVLETQHANTSDLPQLFDQAKIILEHLQNMPDDPSWSDGPLDIPPTLINTIGAIADDLKSELTSLKSRTADLEQQIRESFADMRKHPYRLHAAFFHRGGASGGHYWVYIFDHKREVWRSYNDDRVNVVQNLNEIFGNPAEPGKTGYSTPANPYFLVYVKDDEISKLVESVKREIVYPPPVEAPPIPQFSGFGGSVAPSSTADQPMSQMSAMPPEAGSGDVELMEYAHAHHSDSNGAFPPPPAPPPLPKRDAVVAGDWDNGTSELIRPPRDGW